MKARLLCFVAALLTLLRVCAAFEKEDHEIFRLRDEVFEAEGPDVNFYNFLNVSETASRDEIERAYRKKSKRLHPDKAVRDEIARRSAPKKESPRDNTRRPGVKVTKGPSQKERAKITREANERYARLTTVANILRGPLRDRYDHFLRNGFPIWRGTGYYYARFRPGLGTVLVGLLVVFGGFGHYGAMYMSWVRQREFVQRYVSHARKMAWGNDSGVPGVPGLENITGTVAAPRPPPDDDSGMVLNRRQKRIQEKESKKKENRSAAKSARAGAISRPVDAENVSGPLGSKKKVIAENGKVLIVDSVGNVFLEDNTEEGELHEFLLDPDEIPRPTIYQTALFRLPVFLYSQSAGRVVDMVRGTSSAAEEPLLDDQAAELTLDPSPQKNADGVFQSAQAANANGEVKKRMANAKR